MALGNSNNKTFLSVSDGKVVQRVKEGTPGSHSRATKSGKVVHELRYAYVSGILTGISIRKGDVAGQEIKEWVFDLTDGQDSYSLQIMYDSRYATSLLYALANPEVDFNQPVTITPWMKMVNDKKKTSCYLKQGDKSIDWYFTKDVPNGLPDLSKVTFKGQETWDNYDRMQFLEKFVETKLKPLLGNPFPSPAAADSFPSFTPDPTPEYADYDPSVAPDDDDLPF